MLGNDPVQLEKLANLCDDVATRLGSTRSNVSARLVNTFWQGNDAQRFREAWSGEHDPGMARAVSSLERAARELRSEAAAQRRVSGS